MKKILFLISFFIAAANINHITLAQQEQKNDHLLLIQGNYLRNLGTFGQVWPHAGGGYLGYGMYFSEHYLLIFRTGFMSHTLHSNELPDGTFNVVPLQIGGRYNFTKTIFMPYVQFMNGINLIFENISLTGEKKEETLLRYFWQVGFGSTVILTENLLLDIGINYNSAFYDNNKELYHEAGAMMTGFEYSVGFGWLLN